MSRRVLGVLGGGALPDDLLTAWAESADFLYGADSGALRLIGLGFQPVVVGDMDSFPHYHGYPGLRVIVDPGQDTTDCDKLLALAQADGHGSVTLADLEGDRLDHVIATLSSLARVPLWARVVLRQGLGWIVRPGQPVKGFGADGRRVSLLPLTPCTGVVLRGVAWPVEKVEMVPGGFLSVSNQGVGQVDCSLESGAALLVIERSSSEPPIW